jgi:hypothetical protein
MRQEFVEVLEPTATMIPIALPADVPTINVTHGRQLNTAINVSPLTIVTLDLTISTVSTMEQVMGSVNTQLIVAFESAELYLASVVEPAFTEVVDIPSRARRLDSVVVGQRLAP